MFNYEQQKLLSQKIKDYEYIKDQLLKAFSGLVLDEQRHIYTYNNKKLNSTSSYINQFVKEKFNTNNISLGVSRGQNNQVWKQKNILGSDTVKDFLVDKKDIMIRFKLMADQAIAMGNRVHKFSEMYPFFINPHCDQEEAVISWFKRYVNVRSKYVYICSELKIFDPEHLKAGTIDLVLYNTKTKKLVLCDWKTNNKSLLMGYNNKKLNTPFNEVEDVPYNMYSLQLSDYKNIIEKNTDFEVEDCFIIHLFTKPLNYISKYKNKNNYKQCKSFNLVSKTKQYTLFKTQDFSEKLKSTYSVKNKIAENIKKRTTNNSFENKRFIKPTKFKL